MIIFDKDLTETVGGTRKWYDKDGKLTYDDKFGEGRWKAVNWLTAEEKEDLRKHNIDYDEGLPESK